AGGVRVDEPGADLAVALAVASASAGSALARSEKPLACFGEIGLTGELRYVAHAERRLEEASRFGIAEVIAPAACLEDAGAAAAGRGRGAATLVQALELAFVDRAPPRARAA